MTVDDFATEVEAIGRRFSFIQAIVKLDATRFSVKYRLIITNDLYVQAYANMQNGSMGLALIYQGRRLYGRDCENWSWHRHPSSRAGDTRFFK